MPEIVNMLKRSLIPITVLVGYVSVILSFNFDRYNQEFKDGLWNFMDDHFNERSRHAIIGGVLIKSFAPQNASILDIGCASGTLTDFLSPEHLANYVGMDASIVALSRGREKRPKVNFIHSRAGSFKPGINKFDVIVLNEVLYYLHPELIFRKYISYLTSNTGFMVTSIFQKLSLPQVEDFTRETIVNTTRIYFDIVNEIEIIGNSTHGKMSWLIQLIKPKKYSNP